MIFDFDAVDIEFLRFRQIYALISLADAAVAQFRAAERCAMFLHACRRIYAFARARRFSRLFVSRSRVRFMPPDQRLPREPRRHFAAAFAPLD